MNPRAHRWQPSNCATLLQVHPRCESRYSWAQSGSCKSSPQTSGCFHRKMMEVWLLTTFRLTWFFPQPYYQPFNIFHRWITSKTNSASTVTIDGPHQATLPFRTAKLAKRFGQIIALNQIPMTTNTSHYPPTVNTLTFSCLVDGST